MSSLLLTQASSADGGLDQVLDRFVRDSLVATEAAAVGLHLFDPAESSPVPVAFSGRFRSLRPVDTAVGEHLAGSWSDGGRPTLAPDLLDDLERSNPVPRMHDGCRSLARIPLLEGRRCSGLLQLEADRPGAFGESVLLEQAERGAEALPAFYRALLRERLRALSGPTAVIGVSPAFLALERRLRMVGCFSEGSVLITGERGSGKEWTAWAIHCLSRRRSGPFVPVLSSALTESLLADELFGHEKHAFTGAESRRRGRFEEADGGTLFLDEIGDLPTSAQTLLMRALERGEVQRVGSDRPCYVDVRLLAATNLDLQASVAEGRLRPDFYDRLCVLTIHVPPLRERREDIPLLARYFLRQQCRHGLRHHVLNDSGTGCQYCHVTWPADCATPAFFAALQEYDWPGNVRELKHMMTRLVATVPEETLDVVHLPRHVTDGSAVPREADREEPDLTLDQAVRRHIEVVLSQTGKNQSQAARLLGLPLSTLRSKMKRLGMTPAHSSGSRSESIDGES